MASITVSELPTADEDPEAWNVLWVAGLPVPGICLPLEGERKRDVEHKKSKGSSRDILLDQGLEPSEVTVRIRTTSGPQFRDLYDFYVRYMAPDRALSRLNVVTVSHPALYARGVKQGYFFSAPLPKPTSETGIRPLISEFRFKIVGPKTQISGASGSSKPKQQSKIGGPTDPNFQSGVNSRLQGIASTLGAVGFLPGAPALLLPGVSAESKPRPPDQPVEILTPAQLQKVSDAGDSTANFVSGLFLGRAP